MNRKKSSTKADNRLKSIKGAEKTSSPLHKKHDKYWVQNIAVSTEFEGKSREDIFNKLLSGKRVLHVGYADWPVTDLNYSLHIQLDKRGIDIDGIDPHTEAEEFFKPLVKGRLFRRWEEVTGKYDTVLVPEVMEHVDNVREFLEQLDSANAKQVIITVPDALQCRNAHFDFDKDLQTAVEVVHPDHNYWFSPYTLSNVVKKYTDWTIKGLWFINGISVMLIAEKPSKNIREKIKSKVKKPSPRKKKS